MVEVAEPLVSVRLEVQEQLNQTDRVQVAVVVRRLAALVVLVVLAVPMVVAVVAVLLEELHHLGLAVLVVLAVLKFIHGDLYEKICVN
jgi:hypothetical protein